MQPLRTFREHPVRLVPGSHFRCSQRQLLVHAGLEMAQARVVCRRRRECRRLRHYGPQSAGRSPAPLGACELGYRISPSPLSGSPDRPYNVGSCSYLGPAATLELPASASSFQGFVSSTPKCLWSTAFTPGDSSDHSWLTITSSTWQSAPGFYSLNVSANTGSSPRQLQLTIAGTDVTIIQDPPPPPPGPFTLASPANNATSVRGSVTLSWNPSSNATAYQVYFGTANPPPFLAPSSTTSYTPPPLAANDHYYSVRVIAAGAGGTTNSSVASFTTQLMPGAKAGVFRSSVAFLEDTNRKPNLRLRCRPFYPGLFRSRWTCGWRYSGVWRLDRRRPFQDTGSTGRRRAIGTWMPTTMVCLMPATSIITSVESPATSP